MELAAIRVKILRKPNGHADYPKFGQLPSVQETGMDWSKYVDIYGIGWLYDKVSGHDDEDVDSPRGQQWGVLLIPEVFANEAVAQFPDRCQRLTEAETADFYDNKTNIHVDEEVVDADILKSYQIQIELLKTLEAEATSQEKVKLQQQLANIKVKAKKAIDPDDDAPGLRKNPLARWSSAKAKRGITFKEPPTP
jgi:hypothetical protein